MSAATNAMNPGPVSPSAALPTPDPNAIIQPSLHSVLIGHTFLTLLLPLFIALFYFSTPQTRRLPIFILNFVAIILAFTAGVMIDALAIHSILSVQDPWPPSLNIAIGIIGAFQSMLVDTILLVRLVSVNPLRYLGLPRFAILVSLPVLLKIARVINVIIFIKVLADAAHGPLSSENIVIVWATTPYLKIEWTAQMVDNAYASLAFLWTIQIRGGSEGVASDTHTSRVSFAQRVRVLSRIALSNFIIPSLFSIAQLVVVFRNVDVLIVNEIVLVSTMLAVYGVVFATVWAGINRREAVLEQYEDSGKQHPHEFSVGSWRVAAPPTVTTGSMGTGGQMGGSGPSAGRLIHSEKETNRGVFVNTDYIFATENSRELRADKEDITGSSGSSTPSS